MCSKFHRMSIVNPTTVRVNTMGLNKKVVQVKHLLNSSLPIFSLISLTAATVLFISSAISSNSALMLCTLSAIAGNYILEDFYLLYFWWYGSDFTVGKFIWRHTFSMELILTA